MNPCSVGVVYTTNLVQAPCLDVCREHVSRNADNVFALLINSGNANAVTGRLGYENAKETAKLLANCLEISETSVLVGSTGVIGVPLPMDKMRSGIPKVVDALGSSSAFDAAAAILTTDTTTKSFGAQSPGGYSFGAMAKGSGMIHPNMATMIGCVTTDAYVPAHALQPIVERVAKRTFNRITVDGDTSTNDFFVVLANGASATTPDLPQFELELLEIATSLAHMIVQDGEGATKFVSVRVKGALEEDDAEKVAKCIATSLLVKTALYGKDANWGRVLAAAGRSGVRFDPDNVSLHLGHICLLEKGLPFPFSESEAFEVLEKQKVDLVLDLGQGDQEATVWTSDLSHDYVTINARYRT